MASVHIAETQDATEAKLLALLERGYLIVIQEHFIDKGVPIPRIQVTQPGHNKKTGFIDVTPPNTMANCLDTLLKDA